MSLSLHRIQKYHNVHHQLQKDDYSYLHNDIDLVIRRKRNRRIQVDATVKEEPGIEIRIL